MSLEACLVSFCVSTSNAWRTLARTALLSRVTSNGRRMTSSLFAKRGSVSPVRCRWRLSRVVVVFPLGRRTGQRQTCSCSS